MECCYLDTTDLIMHDDVTRPEDRMGVAVMFNSKMAASSRSSWGIINNSVI